MATINLDKYEKLKTIDRLFSYNSLLDVLLNIETLLDSYNIYAIDKNWLNGEIIKGPIISRYWISILLKFNYEEMPDPETINILKQSNILLKYVQVEEKVVVSQPNASNKGMYKSSKYKTEIKPFWYVQVIIPRHLIECDNYLDEFEEDIDYDLFDSINSDQESSVIE